MSALETCDVRREARVERARAAAEDAVREAGAPFTQWVVMIRDSEQESVATVLQRKRFIAATVMEVLKTPDRKHGEALMDMLDKIIARPTMTPEIISFAEGGTELSFMVPLNDGGMVPQEDAGGGE